MPFNVNNVDITVCANTVFGITSAVLSGLVSPNVLEDPEIAVGNVNKEFFSITIIKNGIANHRHSLCTNDFIVRMVTDSVDTGSDDASTFQILS